MRRTGERKPAWLHSFIPEPNTMHLTPRRCTCGLWVIDDRENVWQTWDYGIVQGDDITVAVILERPLTRITWIPGINQPRLTGVSGAYGLAMDGQYLAAHECQRTRISVKPFKPPRRARQPGSPWDGPDLTETELEEFKRIWASQPTTPRT